MTSNDCPLCSVRLVTLEFLAGGGEVGVAVIEKPAFFTCRVVIQKHAINTRMRDTMMVSYIRSLRNTSTDTVSNQQSHVGCPCSTRQSV